MKSDTILILVIMFFVLGCTFSCDGMKEYFADPYAACKNPANDDANCEACVKTQKCANKTFSQALASCGTTCATYCGKFPKCCEKVVYDESKYDNCPAVDPYAACKNPANDDANCEECIKTQKCANKTFSQASASCGTKCATYCGKFPKCCEKVVYDESKYDNCPKPVVTAGTPTSAQRTECRKYLCNNFPKFRKAKGYSHSSKCREDDTLCNGDGNYKNYLEIKSKRPAIPMSKFRFKSNGQHYTI
jgi:hypothetical protein